MTRRSSRAIFIVLMLSVLGACGGGSKPAEPNWLMEDAIQTNTLAVLNDGTQLSVNDSGSQLRSSNGTTLAAPTLPRGNPDYAVAQQDQFILYGISGNDLWRTTLSSTGLITSDSIVYSGSDITEPLHLQQTGNDILLYWNDSGQVGWYPEALGLSDLHPTADAGMRYSFTPNQRFFFVDNDSSELVEVALGSGLELSRSPVDPAFLGAGSLFVNDGFAVATEATDLHESVDLVLQNRETNVVERIQSLGEFGPLNLQPIGQDGSGNIYYYYYAGYAHAGFSPGVHIRAISNSDSTAWDFDIADGEPMAGRIYPQLKNDGLQFMYVDTTKPITTDWIEFRYTTHFVELGSDGSEITAFYLQPHRTQYLTIGLGAGQTITLENGYIGAAFGTDASGSVYIHGRIGFDADATAFAAQY